jgi:hypothetical protein
MKTRFELTSPEGKTLTLEAPQAEYEAVAAKALEMGWTAKKVDGRYGCAVIDSSPLNPARFDLAVQLDRAMANLAPPVLHKPPAGARFEPSEVSTNRAQRRAAKGRKR